MSRVDNNWRFCEGWLDHKGKQSRGYDRLWCVLKDRTIHIFKEKENRNEDTVVGSLTIDNNTECKYTESDRDGYKFELHTIGPHKTTRANRFKTRKKVEREMWRAYIGGLSKGRVPADLDLMDSQVEEIESRINAFIHEEVLRVSGVDSVSVGGGSKHPPLQKRTSMSRSEDSGFEAASLHPRSLGSQQSHSSSSRDTISGSGGGPTMRHKFTNNPRMDDEVPSWFFSSCTRDLAEKVLVNSGRHGNTLMRESSSQKSSGSYVISKIGKIDGEVRIEHFEVERVDRGYRIKVENDHEPQKNLVAVMNTFRFIAGYENTIPMKTNSLSELGLTEEDANPYHLKRIERELPAQSRELPEPLPDYEEPVQRPKTFNPGILKKERAMYERKTLQRFDGYGTTRSSFVDKYSKTKARTPSPPEFDPPAPHRESVYYNAPDTNAFTPSLQKPRVQSPSTPDPPPPLPHAPSPQGYYNEQEFKDLKGKEPYHKRSMSVPNVKYPLAATPIDIGELDQPATRDVAPPISVVPNAPPPPTTTAPPPPIVASPTQTTTKVNPPPFVTSPTQKTPVPILKSDKRSLPSVPPTPGEEPRSSIDTTGLTAAQLGLKPTKTNPKTPASASSGSSQSDFVPTPQQLGLRPVKDVHKKNELPTKEYVDATSIQDIRRKFEKKIPPSTAPKPTTKGRPKDEEEEETYNDAISVGIPKRSSFIMRLEQQIASPAAGPVGAPKVPEIKPMTEEEEQFYDELSS